ncbi:cytochrome c biogenesis protein CcdA [Cellulomonas sp. APG4]|uniref:cytochrome c biogenesis CcdA family protein n=1 Tax=Cellulomonas sp. APG4 TaxID=1538656 RepID=UPI00137A3975|nr:cytochrome c biogenesis protein CcdA [Cellulomonas sp. APG4]
MDVGYLAAVLGGALALLSPCGALLLPAFLAAVARDLRGLLAHAAVFYVGLAAVLVPLGLGAALLGSLVTQRTALVTAAGWLVIALGLVTALGKGVDLGRLVPRQRAARVGRTGTYLRTLALGGVSGVAGFCAGPILGAVLTVAATRSPLGGGVTLALYALGMVVPLVGIAAVWARLGTGGRAALRGRELRLGRVRTHTMSLATGLLLVAVGVVFLLTNGMAALPELVPAAVLADLQAGIARAGAQVPDVALVLVVAGVVLLAWWGRGRNARRRSAAVDRQEQR